MTESTEKRTHFIRQLITDELASGKHKSLVTRFPPEPNGYLHVGHAKSICLNFGLAEEFGGICYLRFDDTNPIKEEEEYVNAIIDDVRWLGFEWCDMTHSSDYYNELYEFAVLLIKNELAYVDSLSMEEIRAYRGTLQVPGRESPYRNRPMEESLDLFRRMKAGEFAFAASAVLNAHLGKNEFISAFILPNAPRFFAMSSRYITSAFNSEIRPARSALSINLRALIMVCTSAAFSALLMLAEPAV